MLNDFHYEFFLFQKHSSVMVFLLPSFFFFNPLSPQKREEREKKRKGRGGEEMN